MSNAAIDWALRVRVTPTQKLVLLVQANHANDEGACWAGVESLMRQTGLSERAVQLALRALRERGVIAQDGWMGRTPKYVLSLRIEFDADEAPQPAPPPQQVHPAADAPRTKCGEGAQQVRPWVQEMRERGARDAPEPSLKPQEPSGNPQGGSRARDAGRGSRLSADWQLSREDRAYAASRGLDPDALAEAFRDHWHAKAGADAAKLNWSAAWRTWCRNEIAFASRRGAGSPRRAEPMARNPWIAAALGDDLPEAPIFVPCRVLQ